MSSWLVNQIANRMEELDTSRKSLLRIVDEYPTANLADLATAVNLHYGRTFRANEMRIEWLKERIDGLLSEPAFMLQSDPPFDSMDEALTRLELGLHDETDDSSPRRVAVPRLVSANEDDQEIPF